MHTSTFVIAGSRALPTPELTSSAPATPTVEWRRSFSEMEPLAGQWRAKRALASHAEAFGGAGRR
jgi:hypothetical protein